MKITLNFKQIWSVVLATLRYAALAYALFLGYQFYDLTLAFDRASFEGMKRQVEALEHIAEQTAGHKT